MATELYYSIESDGFGFKASIFSSSELHPIARTSWHLSEEMAADEAERMIRRYE
jgi:hypothetical protein